MSSFKQKGKRNERAEISHCTKWGTVFISISISITIQGDQSSGSRRPFPLLEPCGKCHPHRPESLDRVLGGSCPVQRGVDSHSSMAFSAAPYRGHP